MRWAVRLGLPAFFALSQDQPVFSPKPGFPAPWQSGASVYGGVVNLVNGNLALSVPSEDETEYEYGSSGRLKREERTGTVSYVRDYTYHPDGSRATVTRNDALNGEHEEEYAYDEDTGHLLSVTDTVPNPPQVHTFVWNINGTLSRWTDPTENFDRVFSYDEEGRLTKIERDASSSLTPALAFFYSDGIKTRTIDFDHQMEYRYGCTIDCSGSSLRTLGRSLGTTEDWHSFDDWLLSPNGTIIARHWNPIKGMEETPIDEQVYIHADLFGVPLLTNQAGDVISRRGSSTEHCESLKEKLYALKPGSCKQPVRCLSPMDCKNFNNLLYSFCYECQNNNNFRLECDALSNWYYTQSGCKGQKTILPYRLVRSFLLCFPFFQLHPYQHHPPLISHILPLNRIQAPSPYLMIILRHVPENITVFQWEKLGIVYVKPVADLRDKLFFGLLGRKWSV